MPPNSETTVKRRIRWNLPGGEYRAGMPPTMRPRRRLRARLAGEAA